MADIAQLGFSVDTGDLKDAKASLDALVPSASRAETATEKVGAAFSATSGAADRAAADIRETGNAANQAAGGINNLGGAVDNASAGLRQYDAHVRAFHAANGRIKDGVNEVGQALRFNAREGLNFTRQLSDIGVTAAMGMNPLMIALQQGPQLFDILQEKAISSGTTIGAVFRAAGAQIWAAMAPLLPLILGIAAVVGVVAAAFALGTREINKGNASVVDGLGLTERQLERVKKAGVDTGVTVGDTFKAFFQVIGQRLTEAFDGPLTWLREAWNTTLDFITEYGAKAIEMVVGAFVGAVYAIRSSWRLLPGALGDVIMQGANAVIAGVEWMINKSIDGLNWLLSFANAAAERMGLSGFGQIGQVGLGRAANPYAGQGQAFGNAISSGMEQGLNESRGMVTRFFADVGRQARENARNRIRAAAGDAGSGRNRRERQGPKTDAEKFEDIVAGANRDIAEQNARAAAAAVTMTAEAAATLEYRQKLLNEAQSKGITLTDAMRSEIDRLAEAYGRAKVAADNAVALRDILQGADRNIAGIRQQAEMVGLYGRNLAYATEMARLLNEAQGKMTPEAIAAARPEFERRANEYADASASLERDRFMEETRRAAQERMTTLEQERAAIGLSADETTRLRIENELLAQARQKNIDLSPADIASIQGIAREQAAVENAIRRTREALDFAKDITKGFFQDLRNNLQQGQTLWEAFGNAVLGVLNKIIDKLMDRLLNNLIDGLFASAGNGGAGGGITSFLQGLFNAKGNVFGPGGLMAFASGGAFTNGVVNRPTAFAFGRGKLGVMGEAGDEAIMPLQRGPDGSLGVQMYGDASGGTVINAPVTVNNDNRVSGAVSSNDIVEMQRRASEQTKRDLARQIPQILQQYQRDGAMV